MGERLRGAVKLVKNIRVAVGGRKIESCNKHYIKVQKAWLKKGNPKGADVSSVFYLCFLPNLLVKLLAYSVR